MSLEFVQEIKVGTDPGILALSKPDESGALQIRVATSSGCFATTKSTADLANDFKIEPTVNVLDHLQALLTSIGKNTARTLELEQNNDSGSLQIRVKERMSSGMVRLLWNIQVPESGSIMDLSIDLLRHHLKTNARFDKLKFEYSELELDRNDWKDTAEKIENGWETEKTQLLSNFCELYQNSKRHHEAKQKDLQEHIDMLQAEKQQQQRAASRARQPLPEVLQNVPDDGAELYDPEMVKQLASGKPASRPAANKRKAPVAKKRAPRKKVEPKAPPRKIAAQAELKPAEPKVPDAKPEGKEPEEKPAAAKKKKKPSLKQLAMLQDDSSDSSSDPFEEAPPVKRRKPIASKKRDGTPPQNSKPETPPSKKSSSTDAASSPEDDLEAEIMADIEAMQSV